jgi:hypothetical protein
MAGEEVTLEEIYAEIDKRIAAAIEKLKADLEPRLAAIEKRLPAEKKPFKVIR